MKSQNKLSTWDERSAKKAGRSKQHSKREKLWIAVYCAILIALFAATILAIVYTGSRLKLWA